MIQRCCALSGHRELENNFDQNALFYCLEDLVKEGYTYFCCGMALGFDLLALECLVELKKRYHVRIEACIPFKGQKEKFSLSERRKYEELLEKCDVKTELCEHYYNGCMLARNRYMVDKCDILFAYCKKNTGGTYYTVNYARTHDIPVRYFEGR